uniref:Uncharacterized protein TCIL3000_6_1530 n=1 Tax=Trypanosoma congolense (strain IL3000) TaxID=1068625 RepID=G0UNF9_TRYCI|nr:unnamed protein product [Trypanosoma congolense IL3000]
MAVKAAVRIFDLIDKGMLGNAEGMLEGILPKFPNDHTLLAAEVLLLLNKGELGKCRAKAEYLSQQDVREENANKALVYALQQCCSWDALAHTYQRLKDSHNEKDTMENLFQTYVRMGAYNKAQQIAAQLQRKWPDPRYQLWVVQANLAQVPHDSVDHVLLKLSTKLVDSIIVADKGVLSTSASRMFVEILQRQGLYGDAVDFLCSKRGWRVGLPEARLEMLAVTLQLNGEKGKANAVAKQAWRRQPDNWTFVQLYLKSLSEEDQSDGLMELDGPDESKRMTVDVSDGDRTLADALRFARSLSKVVCETAAKGHVPRGPFMAELEILSLLGDVAQLREAIVAYAQRFFRLSCCYLDVSTYLDAASAEAIYTCPKKI